MTTTLFRMCGHPEWPAFPKPEPTRTIGSCALHNYICPLCGFGAGTMPPCDCNTDRTALSEARRKIEESGIPLKNMEQLERETSREPDEDRWFGSHIREAIGALKSFWTN